MKNQTLIENLKSIIREIENIQESDNISLDELLNRFNLNEIDSDCKLIKKISNIDVSNNLNLCKNISKGSLQHIVKIEIQFYADDNY